MSSINESVARIDDAMAPAAGIARFIGSFVHAVRDHVVAFAEAVRELSAMNCEPESELRKLYRQSAGRE